MKQAKFIGIGFLAAVIVLLYGQWLRGQNEDRNMENVRSGVELIGFDETENKPRYWIFYAETSLPHSTDSSGKAEHPFYKGTIRLDTVTGEARILRPTQDTSGFKWVYIEEWK